MATNLNIDTKLLNEALGVGKHKTKRDAVNTALREYVQRHKQMGIIELFGTLDFEEGYDYKAARSGDTEDISTD